MKKLFLSSFMFLAVCLFSTIVAHAGSTGTYTVNVGSWGGVKYSPEMTYTSQYTYAVSQVTSVSGGDTYDIRLLTYYGGLFISTGGFTTISASDTSYKAEFAPEDITYCRAGYDYTISCGGDNTTSSKCVLANKRYKLEYYNGSILGGTVSITASLYANN